jgi:hypothetical protein
MAKTICILLSNLGSLSKLKTVANIECQRESYNQSLGTGSYLLTFHSYPLQPYENNHFSHTGNFPLSAFKCNSSLLDGEDAVRPYCELEDVLYQDELLPLYAECSNHGSCDYSKGKCMCQRGFKGLACNDTRDSQVPGFLLFNELSLSPNLSLGYRRPRTRWAIFHR